MNSFDKGWIFIVKLQSTLRATARVTTENSARVTHLHASALIIGRAIFGSRQIRSCIASGRGCTLPRGLGWVAYQLKTRCHIVSVQPCAARWLVASAWDCARTAAGAFPGQGVLGLHSSTSSSAIIYQIVSASDVAARESRINVCINICMDTHTGC